MGGKADSDPGGDLDNSMVPWAMRVKHAAEDLAMVGCCANFDPGGVLENAMDPGTRRVKPAA